MIYIYNELVETSIFPGGESHVKLPSSLLRIEEPQFISMEAYLYTPKDIMELLLVVNALNQEWLNVSIDLTIPYVPYARQDRVCNRGEALSAKVMANLINSLECNSISIRDPHSDVISALLNNCIVFEQSYMVESFNLNNKWAIVSPDAGAQKKIRKIKTDQSIFYASKIRDTKTGEITGTKVEGNVDGLNLIIIDDICDGGRTFIELAKVLKSKGANELRLYITHGIFSKGLDELFQYFEEIFCYHTFLTKEEYINYPNLKIFPKILSKDKT